MNKNQNCENCYKIKCKNCGWEPNGLEVKKVLSGHIKNCPDCGSPPSN